MKANMQLYIEVDESNETIASYDFYYGNINITVTGNFDKVSMCVIGTDIWVEIR